MQKTCQTCGEAYEAPPSIKPKYCSSACAGIAKRKGQHKSCEQCGGRFWVPPSKDDQTYCSKSCARTALNLTEANPSYHRDISGENNPMYGRGMSGSDNPMYGMRKELSPRWKGGRKVRADGYVLVVCDDEHPNPSDVSASGTKYILEHRLVMEHHLGRYLDPEEVVHHKDGDPSNNSFSNLELFANQSEHISVGHG